VKRLALICIYIWASLFGMGQATSQTLSDKLVAQWKLFAAAQAYLVNQVQRQDLPAPQKLIPRQQWESMLFLGGPLAITSKDLSELQGSQKKRILQAKNLNRLNSKFDLDIVRSKKTSSLFCAAVPKGGMLHIHPSGTLDRVTASGLLQSLNPKLDIASVLNDVEASEGNVTLLPTEKSWLQSVPQNSNYLTLNAQDQQHFESFLFLPSGKQAFSRFNGVFEFIGFALPDWASYDQVLLNFAQKAVREGVSYVEFTTGAGPNLYAHLSTLEKKTGLTIRINNSFNRTEDPITLGQKFEKLLSAPPNSYLVGIDFLDNEETNPAFEKGQQLYGEALSANLSGKSTLHRTMHAGEIGDVRNPRDAMIMGAQRLGHGVNLAKDPIALEYAIKIQEPVEINISSNLRLTDVDSVATHPFLEYLRLGLPVSLSTDDEGIFEIDIKHECVIAVDQTDMSYNEFKQMAFNSIKTSFASDADKNILLNKLTQQFDSFESSFKIQ